jgi:SAM-dependent methyltransferase
VREEAAHDYQNVFLKSCAEVAEFARRSLTDASILVLGCGYTYPEVVLFSTVCRHVVGLDVISAFYRDGVFRTLRDKARRSGMTAALKSVPLRYRYTRYYRFLEELSGVPVSHNKYLLISFDGRRMPFEDEAFDIVVSNSVLQEVEDLKTVFLEVHRVTRKRGVSYHLWHNYYGFSGSYMPEALCAKHPWGHLRGKYVPKTRFNKATPTQISDIFSTYFDDVSLYSVDRDHRKKGRDRTFELEGEELLSEEIRWELRDLPVDLLLTRSYLIVDRKKQ